MGVTAILSWNGVLHRKWCGVRRVFAWITVPAGEEFIGFLYGPATHYRRCRRCWR